MEAMHGQGMGGWGGESLWNFHVLPHHLLSNPMCLPIWKLTQSHGSKAPKELNI